MYSSLDRADIALSPTEDGTPQFVQTDHRSAKEIESQSELSAVFALIRLLNPKRMTEGDTPEPVVIYSCQERPPEFLRSIISSAGGRLVWGSEQTPDPDFPDPQPLTDVINSAIAELASATQQEFSIEPSIGGLTLLETTLSNDFKSADSDEFAYWSAVLKLGSFGGELIRESNHGSWVTVDTGSLPFALSTSYNGEPATVNPLGKAIKFFEYGEDDSFVPLVSILTANP